MGAASCATCDMMAAVAPTRRSPNRSSFFNDLKGMVEMDNQSRLVSRD